jgi:hypothetical protein
LQSEQQSEATGADESHLTPAKRAGIVEHNAHYKATVQPHAFRVATDIFVYKFVDWYVEL